MTNIIIAVFSVISKPILWFWACAQNYKKTKEYGKMLITFFLSLLLVALMGFTIFILLLCLFIFCRKHIGVTVTISAVIWLYWAVWNKHFANTPVQDPAPVEDPNMVLLRNNAINGYRDMKTIIFRLLKEYGNMIGVHSPVMYLDIETLEKYNINCNCVFYQFSIGKADIHKQFSDEELDEDAKILQDGFDELWHRGAFPSISLQTYTDNNGTILPPVSICTLMDIGNKILIQTVYTSPAYVAFLNNIWQEQNTSQNIGYDTTDSRLL